MVISASELFNVAFKTLFIRILLYRVIKKKMVSEVQSVMFNRDKWSISKAKHWLSARGYKLRYRTTKQYYRFRQTEPSKYKRFRIEKKRNGIELVIGFVI